MQTPCSARSLTRPFETRCLRYFFLFLWLLRCFTSPGTLSYPMYSDTSHYSSYNGVSPFGNSRIKGCLPPPRDLSQAATSFIGSSLPSHPPYALSCFDHSDPDQRSALNGSYAYLCFRCIENDYYCNYIVDCTSIIFLAIDDKGHALHI